jgi:hypothetical protein
VDGSRSDVTLTFENPSGFTAAECPMGHRHYEGMFRVQGTASSRLFGDRDPGDYSMASHFEQFVTSDIINDIPSFHQGSVSLLWVDCDDAAAREHLVPIVFVADWADVDASIEKIGRALNEEALGETVLVAVQQVFCED